jgi:hypothetical protein
MNTAKPKVYPMKTVWRIYALIFPLMGLAFPTLFGWALLNANRPADTATWAVVIIGSLLLFALCMAIYVGMTRVRLEVSPQGIAYHSLSAAAPFPRCRAWKVTDAASRWGCS